MAMGVSSRGYCAAKDERYYGLKGHVMINLDGYVTACPVALKHHDRLMWTNGSFLPKLLTRPGAC